MIGKRKKSLLTRISGALAFSGKREAPGPERQETPAKAPVFDDVGLLLERMRDTSLLMQHEYSGASATLSSQVTSLSETLAVLYPTMVTLQGTCLEQAKKNEGLEKANRQLGSKLASALEELACQKQRAVDFGAQVDALSAEIGAFRERADSLTYDLSKQVEANRQLETAVSVERRRTSELESAGKAVQARLAKRESELLAARNEVAQLTNDLTETRITAEARQKALDRLSARLAEEQAANTRSEALLIQTNNDLQTARQMLRRTEKDFAASRSRHEAEIERARAESNEAQYGNEALRARVSTLEKILKSQRTKLENSSTYIAQLQGSMRRLVSERVLTQEVDLSFGLDDDEVEAGAAETGEPHPQAQEDGPGDDRENGSQGATVVKLMAGGHQK